MSMMMEMMLAIMMVVSGLVMFRMLATPPVAVLAEQSGANVAEGGGVGASGQACLPVPLGGVFTTV